MDVRGNSVSIADDDSSPSATDDTDWGFYILASQVPKTFTIYNLGDAILNLSGSPRVVVGGAHAADFTVTSQPAATVAANGTSTFTVQFSPSVVGLRSAALSIANDDATENPYNFSLQGTGTAGPFQESPGVNITGKVNLSGKLKVHIP